MLHAARPGPVALALLAAGCAARSAPVVEPPSPLPPPRVVAAAAAAAARAPAVTARLVAWSDTPARLGLQVGSVVTVHCPPGQVAAPAYGTDVYTDDSAICTAALHAGRASLASGGTFAIEVRPRADGYVATLRNGVASRARPSATASFAFVEGPLPGLHASAIAPAPAADDPWQANASARRGRTGEAFAHDCPPGSPSRTAWGTDVYTDDSSICAAALHAGRITAEAGGRVTYYVLPGRSAYFGSARNGVTTSDYDAFPGSFAFDREPQETAVRAPPGLRVVTWSTNAASLRGRREPERVFCVPNGTLRSVWGTGEYTDDSSICTAAVHAGLVAREAGGVVTVRHTPGRGRYQGSTAHGVESRPYDAFAGSFVFVR